MHYQIVQREEDNYVKFYVGRKEDDSIYAVPCVLDDSGNVDITATQTKMDAHIEYTDEILSYL